MERTPVKNEFARTSTPRYSIFDSGFCGSGIKPYPSNPFYSLSPIKESPSGFKEDAIPFSRNSFHTFTPLKFHYNSTFDSNQNLIQLSKSDVIKQLSFEDSGIGNESYNQQVRHSRFSQKKDVDDRSDAPYFSPCYNRSPRIRTRVNFLARLKKMNCERIISDLLSYLPAEDLCRMSCVDKMWKELIIEDVKANGRRREYLKSINSYRENRSRSGSSPYDIKRRYEQFPIPRLVLNNITNGNQESKISSKCCDPRFDSFVREGNNIGGPLMKCPSCKYAARKKENDEYICTNCDYNFCKKCLSPYLNNHKCPMLQVPTLIIGSKQCKRNLKRL